MLHISFLLASFQWKRSVNQSRHLDNCSTCNMLGNYRGTFTFDLMFVIIHGGGGRGFQQ